MTAPTILTKLPDWQLRLEAFVAQRRAMPFTWGTNDCCTFAADAVAALTGDAQVGTGLRAHRTAKQACRTIARHGGIAAIATAACGQPHPAAMAGVGDVVLVTVGKRDALAICNGGTALAPSSAGLVAVPMAHARQCWRLA
jgi:hypothetical protein